MVKCVGNKDLNLSLEEIKPSPIDTGLCFPYVLIVKITAPCLISFVCIYSNRCVPPCIRSHSLLSILSCWKWCKDVMGILVQPEKEEQAAMYQHKEERPRKQAWYLQKWQRRKEGSRISEDRTKLSLVWQCMARAKRENSTKSLCGS